MEQVGFQEKTVEDYLKLSPGDLKVRRKFLNVFILKPLQTDPEWMADPRQPKALAYYLEQRRLINQAIQQKTYEDGPPAQSVQLEALSVTGAARR